MKLSASKMSAGITERNISHRRHRRKCEDKIIMDLRDLVCAEDKVRCWDLVNTNFRKEDYFDQLNTYKLLINKSIMFWDVPPLSSESRVKPNMQVASSM